MEESNAGFDAYADTKNKSWTYFIHSSAPGQIYP